MKKITIILAACLLTQFVCHAQDDFGQQMSNMMMQSTGGTFSIGDSGASSMSSMGGGGGEFSSEAIPNASSFTYAEFYGQLAAGAHKVSGHDSATYFEAQFGFTYQERKKFYSSIGFGIGYISDKEFSFLPAFVNYKLLYSVTKGIKAYGTFDFGATVPINDIKDKYAPNMLFGAGVGVRFNVLEKLSLFGEYKWRVNDFTVSDGNHVQESYNSQMVVFGIYF